MHCYARWATPRLGTEAMKSWIVLPYDASTVARASLRRAARPVVSTRSGDAYAGIVLATAGFDPSEFDRLMHEAEAIAGPGVPLELDLLDPGDPVGALHHLADSLPAAVLAAPLEGKG